MTKPRKSAADPETIFVDSITRLWYSGPSDPVDVEGERRLFTGSDDDTREDLAALADLGVSSFMFRFVGGNMAETEEAMARFRGDIYRVLDFRIRDTVWVEYAFDIALQQRFIEFPS